MKRILFYFLYTICSFSAWAQSDSTVKEQHEEADFHYGNAADKKARVFEVKREPVVFRRAFKVNSAGTQAEVYDRALGFARMTTADFREDKKKGIITVPVSWRYSGGFNECVEDMQVHGRLVIEVKELKTRISLTDITYEHRDKANADAKPVAKTDFFSKHADCAPEKGKVELLYNCTECSRSIKSIEKNLQSRFEAYANQYQERLKKY
jgi:hypothetical protein